MADRYWVGGSGTWDSTSTTHWAASSNGASGASAPTTSDNVIFDNNSDSGAGFTVTMGTSAACLDMSFGTGASALDQTMTWAGTTAMTIAGNMTLVSTNLTVTYSGTISFTATTAKTITSAGKTLGGLTFNGVSGTWSLQDAFTISATATLTNGTLDLNNNSLTCSAFSSNNSNTRALGFSTSGSITTTGTGQVWATTTVTGLSVTGTSSVTISNNTATATTVNTGALSETNSISFSFINGTYSLSFLQTVGYTARNVDFTGFAGTWAATAGCGIYGNLKLATGMTLTASTSTMTFGATSGTQQITSNGKTMDFPITFDGVGGTFKLIDNATIGSTRTTTLTNGTLDLNDKTLSTGLFASTNSNTRTLAFGIGKITATGNSATAINISNGTSLTTTGTVIFEVTNATASGLSLGTTVGYWVESKALPVSIGTSSGSTGIYVTNTTTLTLAGVYGAMDFTGFTGTLANSTRTIYGNLKIATGMTLTAGALNSTFGATSGTQQITSNGKTMDFPIAFDGVGGTFQLQDNLTVGSSRATSLTNGTLDLADKAFVTGAFASTNSNTRTLAFGTTGTITTKSTGTVWNFGTVTGLSVTGTSSVTIDNNTATSTTVSTGALSETNAINFNFINGTYTLTFLQSNTFSAKNVDFTGFAGTWAATGNCSIYGNLKLATGMTLTASTSTMTFGATSGTQQITSNGKTMDFPITFNGIGGTFQLQDNLTVGSTRTTTLTNGIFDLADKALVTGAFASTNSNTRTLAFGTTGTITTKSTGTVWTTATVTGLSVTGTSSVTIDNNTATSTTVSTGALSETNSISFNFINGTYILIFLGTSGYTAKNVDFTGFAGTWFTTSTATIYGNLKLATGMTLTASNGPMTFGATSGTQQITSNGKTMDFPITFNGIGGTFTPQDNMTLGSTRPLTLTNGTLNLNGQTVTTGTFATAAGTKAITANGGTITVSGSGATAWYNVAPTNFSTSAGTGNGTISMTSASAKTFVGGGSTYTFKLDQGGAGTLTITGSNTFSDISNSTQPATITFTAGTTTTLTSAFSVSGTSGNRITLNTATAGSRATLSIATGTISVTNCSIKDLIASGGAYWKALLTDGNLDAGNNPGWFFGTAHFVSFFWGG